MEQTKYKSTPYQQKKRRKPKKITPTYLHNAGLYYLERFAASKNHFKTVMMRKVKRSCHVHEDQDYEACREMVEQLADKFVNLGLLNDTLYAEGQVNSMRRKGMSRRAIINKMRMKGIDFEQVEEALKQIDNENTEYESALKLARKKKIGPFFIGEEQNIKKSLGILARAGFSYEIASKIVKATLEDEF